MPYLWFLYKEGGAILEPDTRLTELIELAAKCGLSVHAAMPLRGEEMPTIAVLCNANGLEVFRGRGAECLVYVVSLL